MQRKKSKNTRLANADEKAFQAFTKESECICCGNYPVIVDHIWGSTKKTYVDAERVLIGHYAVLPLCLECDSIKTQGSRKLFRQFMGSPIALFEKHVKIYPLDIPINVLSGILRESA